MHFQEGLRRTRGEIFGLSDLFCECFFFGAVYTKLCFYKIIVSLKIPCSKNIYGHIPHIWSRPRLVKIASIDDSREQHIRERDSRSTADRQTDSTTALEKQQSSRAESDIKTVSHNHTSASPLDRIRKY
jgi:hypothetical protein